MHGKEGTNAHIENESSFSEDTGSPSPATLRRKDCSARASRQALMNDGKFGIRDVLEYTQVLCKWPESAGWSVDSLRDIPLHE